MLNQSEQALDNSSAAGLERQQQSQAAQMPSRMAPMQIWRHFCA